MATELRLKAFFFWLAKSDELLSPAKFLRKRVDACGIAPGTERLEESAAPARGKDVLDRWPAGTDDGLEIVDETLGFALEPGSPGVGAESEIEPALGGPFFRRTGERNLILDVAVHGGALGDGRVVINDDFALLVNAF